MDDFHPPGVHVLSTKPNVTIVTIVAIVPIVVIVAIVTIVTIVTIVVIVASRINQQSATSESYRA